VRMIRLVLCLFGSSRSLLAIVWPCVCFDFLVEFLLLFLRLVLFVGVEALVWGRLILCGRYIVLVGLFSNLTVPGVWFLWFVWLDVFGGVGGFLSDSFLFSAVRSHPHDLDSVNFHNYVCFFLMCLVVLLIFCNFRYSAEGRLLFVLFVKVFPE
jgi:hypothetical protein